MKNRTKISQFTALSALLFCASLTASSHNSLNPDQDKEYYGIEINGQLCGYTEFTVEDVIKDGKELQQEDLDIFVMFSLLGSQVNTSMNMRSQVDPVTKRTEYYKLIIDQGDTHRETEISVKDNIAYVTPLLNSDPYQVKLSDDVLFGDSHLLKRISEDFRDKVIKERIYTTFAPMEGELHRIKVIWKGTDEFDTPDTTYSVNVFTVVNLENGLKVERWVDTSNAEQLQFTVANRRVYLADRSVVDQIKLADMDNSFITKTNVKIGDIQSISYMKLEARIEPTGISLSAGDLNVPGQKFEGTVKDNLIEGIFEIGHKRYDGSNAPPFPHKYDEALNNYLASGNFIESDDPVLTDKAREITAGSADSWQAACRLSTWVAKEIGYAIPGGGTARNTYDTRAGECGAHSILLATFCRAVGIPARVVWGAMYISNYGGAFGQHAWNEIYMGDAGWIPVDATAYEYNFLDSGHIRIGEYTSMSTAFNGKSIRVLESRLLSDASDEEQATSNYDKFLGNYKSGDRHLMVKIENMGLVLDIPGKAVLPFNDPDNRGYWYCKIAPHIYVDFMENDEGKISTLNFHQMMTLTRKNTDSKIKEEIPDMVRPLVGEYNLPGTNYSFSIFCREDTLYFKNLAENNESVMTQLADSQHVWVDDKLKTYRFNLDKNGIASSVKVDVLDKLYKD